MPYKKKIKTHNFQAKKLVIIAAIVITALALAGAGIWIYCSYQAEQEAKAAAALEALPRIVVPQGHFATPAYEKASVDKNIKSLTVRPGIDIYTKNEASQEALEKEIDALLADLKTLDFNHIILDTSKDGSVIFASSKLKNTPIDFVKIFLDKAKAASINVSLKLDLTGLLKADETKVDNLIDYKNKRLMAQTAADLARQYEFYSLQLDSYYAQKNGATYKAFIESGMRENYEEWLLKSANVAFSEIIDAVKTSKSTLPIGLCIDNVWANINKENEKTTEGSKTQAEFEALLDGHVDTKGLLKSGKIDFINAVIPTSIPNDKEPFKTIVNYWGALCKTSALPMYVTHSGENASSKELIGWNGTDELSRQVALAVKSGNYYGSSFTGVNNLISDLEKSPDSGSTNYLLSYFRDEIKEAEMFSNLDIISPQKSSSIVYEDTIQFKMKFDPNAEVLLNGEKLTPSSRGGVSVWVPLNVGKNTIKLEHKGRTKIYNVERKVIIFKEVTPTGTIKVAGSSTIELSALAYTGSKISATINGKTVALTEGGGGDDNNAESAYRTFTGTYTVPKAKPKDQNIGAITFNGNYKNIYSASAKGASITIEKLADEVDPDSATGQPFTHATVTNLYAATFPYKTTGFPQAILYQLPYGTQDIVVSENGDYLNLRSGITVLKKDVSLDTKNFEGNNQVTQMTVGVEGNDTVIRATMNWKAPFSLMPSPYTSVPLGKENYNFTADTITILLDYTTVIKPENISGDMGSSPIFSGISCKRVKNESLGIWQYQVTLPLRQAGRYYGCHAQWEDNTLVFKFNHPATGGNLNGMKIAVDPGHGGSESGNTAGRDSVEKDTNLLAGFDLKNSLEALGATVVMTRTSDVYVSLEERVKIAERNECDLFISVHQNSVTGGDQRPNGAQTYYNAPFSQPLAKYVEESLKTVVPQSIWNYWNGSLSNFGFVVTRERQFPSILVECAFSTNPNDEARMLDETSRKQFIDALAQGVLNYYAAYN